MGDSRRGAPMQESRLGVIRSLPREAGKRDPMEGPRVCPASLVSASGCRHPGARALRALTLPRPSVADIPPLPSQVRRRRAEDHVPVDQRVILAHRIQRSQRRQLAALPRPTHPRPRPTRDRTRALVLCVELRNCEHLRPASHSGLHPRARSQLRKPAR